MTPENKSKIIQHGQPLGIESIPEEDELKLLEYLLIILKHKKMIFLTILVAFLVTSGITLLMPNIYISTARILPPQESKGSISSTLGGIGDLAALAGFSTGGGTEHQYVGILKTRTIADAIIERFDLMNHYEWTTRSDAYKALGNKIRVELGKDDGIISISIEDENPELAAKIVNAYVEELKKINVGLNLTNASRERLFLEDRLKLVKVDLSKSEDALKVFQEKNNAIRIDAQANAIIEVISDLKGQLASKEIELSVMLSFQTELNPQVIALRDGIIEIKEQISRLERSPEGENVSGNIFLATSDVPELGIQYARFMRDFKVQETLFELLTKQYEIAKINEAKNTSTIQILDEGIVADKKSKPQRSKIVLVVTFIAGFCALIYSFIREYGQHIDPEDKKLWNEIKQQLCIKNSEQNR